MAKRESQEKLTARLASAADKVVVGAKYRHYKDQIYTVLALALREEDNEPCVVYRAEYGDRISFTRPVANWIEQVEIDGKKVNRFTLLS